LAHLVVGDRAWQYRVMDVTEIAATIGSLPGVLDALLTPIDPVTLRTRPEEGEWCPLEVIGHLIACDSDAFRDRIKGIVAGSGRLNRFDAWDAINERDFAAEPLDVLLAELAAERAESCAYIVSLSDDELAMTARTSDGRTFAASDFVHEWSFHDQDHLQQILACLKLAYLPGMSPAMQEALASS
jgi:hypothetical protein